MPEAVDSELNDLRMSAKNRPLLDAVVKHIRENVDPITEEFFRLGEGRAERWGYAPGQLELLEGAKQKARDAGLWNFFLPNAETGEGLSNLDYAFIAAELGKSHHADGCGWRAQASSGGGRGGDDSPGTVERSVDWLPYLIHREGPAGGHYQGMMTERVRGVSCGYYAIDRDTHRIFINYYELPET